ncbi:MAG TPA: protein kinase [Gemmataceae bacterium]|nr:protein kinase [Gemmataceae bacterium]
MVGLGCVSEADLRALLAGELSEPIVRAITLHLESCPACEAVAQRLDGLTDPFVRSLRGRLHPSPAGATIDPQTTPVQQQCQPELTADVLSPLPKGDGFPQAPAGYEILEELGRGGMSIVYRARQSQPQRLVALKMLLAAAHAPAERRLRFLAEADAIARLQHPGIVQVYEVGDQEGVPFLVLELMGGGSLSQKLAARPLPGRQAAELVETLARAVDHAHAHGVIHRDLKPANVLLGADGLPKISDFGLAKQERPELTATGEVLGTPSYMAPEQTQGGSQRLGPAADIYALGTILYELLTGRPPFLAATVLETLNQVRTREPVPPGKLAAATPRDLETICLKCLHKEPQKRYATAGALADDLRRFLEYQPIRGRPVGRPEKLWRWCRRNPLVAGLLGAVATLLFVLAIGNRLSAYRLQQLARKADDQAERVRLEEAERKRELDTLLDRAASYAAYRGWNQSLGYLNQAVETRPDSSLAFTRRGQFYARFYLWDLAAPDSRAAFALQPSGDPHLWRLHAALALYQGDQSAYRQTCGRMLEQFGASPDAEDQARLGQVCGLGPGGLVDRARLLHLAEQGLGLRPNDRFRQLVLGTLYYRAGQLDRAIPLLQNSVEDNFDSFNLQGWPVLAMACRQAGRAEEARRWLEKMNQRVEQLTSNFPVEPLEDDLDLPPNFEWLADCLLRREAQAWFDGPTTADRVLHWLVQSRGLAKLGRWDEAQAAFSRVIELRPTQGRFRLDRAHFFARRNQWQLAAADFDDAYRLGARDRVFDWYCYALCRLRMEDDEGYRRICREVVRRFGGRPPPKNALEVVELNQVASICFLRANADANLQLATRLARTALAADPDDAMLLLGSSAAYLRGGEPAKAIPELHKALGKRWKMNLDWGGPVIAWLQLSMAHHQLGQVEEGRSWFNKAVQRIDGDVSIRESEATGIRWHLWALFEIMRREAAALYGQTTLTPAGHAPVPPREKGVAILQDILRNTDPGTYFPGGGTSAILLNEVLMRLVYHPTDARMNSDCKREKLTRGDRFRCLKTTSLKRTLNRNNLVN